MVGFSHFYVYFFKKEPFKAWFPFAAVVLFQASRCTKPRPFGRAWGSQSDPAAPAVSSGRFHQGSGIPKLAGWMVKWGEISGNLHIAL